MSVCSLVGRIGGHSTWHCTSVYLLIMPITYAENGIRVNLVHLPVNLYIHMYMAACHKILSEFHSSN